MEEKTLKKIVTLLEEYKQRENFNEIENFHNDRIKKIKKNEISIPLFGNGKLVIHLIPFESFKNPKYYDVSNLNTRIRSLNLNKLLLTSHTYNFDGLLYFRDRDDKKCYEYVQIFRNGIIEAAHCNFYSSEEKILYILDIERKIISIIKNSLILQKELGFKPRIVFYFDLLGVKNFLIKTNHINIFSDHHPMYMEDLNFPKIIINKFDIEVEKMLKMNFDRIWNACGYPGSDYYDKNGMRKE